MARAHRGGGIGDVPESGCRCLTRGGKDPVVSIQGQISFDLGLQGGGVVRAEAVLQ
jgi:hypothetical protein